MIPGSACRGVGEVFLIIDLLLMLALEAFNFRLNCLYSNLDDGSAMQ